MVIVYIISVTPRCVSTNVDMFCLCFECVYFCRENTIGVLQVLLLDLLAKRAEMLLQPIDVEVTGIVDLWLYK